MATSLAKGMMTFIEEAVVGFIKTVSAIKVVFKTIGSGIMGVIDIINFLPPVVRELGIIGFLALGTKGRLLVFAIGLIINQIQKLLKKLGIEVDLGLNKGLEETNNKIDGARKIFERMKKEIELNTIEVAEMKKKVEEANIEAEKLKRNISPFRKEIEKLNEDSLKKLTNLSKQAFEIFEMGVKGLSKGIAESIVLGKDLGNTFKNLADQILVKLIGALVEVAIKIGVQIALENTTIVALLTKLGIEKQITAEKKEQNKETKKSNKQNLISTALMFLGGNAQGGSLRKGEPTLVGERGPELFIPNSSGQITQNARGMGGRSAVVNFNINTIDSRGFDEALEENRGTITAIINNALAEKGRGELV